MKPVVVVPTYNERGNLDALVQRLRGAVDCQILIVDDNSPDGTADHAEALNQQLGGITVARRAGKSGLASAYVHGFRLALEQGAQRVVQMDGDLSHDPAALPGMLALGHDLVLGSRWIPGGGTRNWPRRRQLLSRFGSVYARRALSLPQRDLTGGFKVWRAPLLAAVLEQPVRSSGYAFQVELTLRAVRLGATVTEVPITFTERTQGESKMGGRIALEAAWLVPRLRWG